MPSKFLNADDTVDLIKSGVGALDDKIENYIKPNFKNAPYSNYPNTQFLIKITQSNQTVTLNCYGQSNDAFVIFDMGDGGETRIDFTSPYTKTSASHTYNYPGYYLITIKNEGGNGFGFGGYTESTDSVFISPNNVLEEVYLNSGYSISPYTFYNQKNFKKITFLHPNSLTEATIPKYAFAFSAIKTINYINLGIYNTFYDIKDYAFFGCSNLINVRLQYVWRFADGCFAHCNRLEDLSNISMSYRNSYQASNFKIGKIFYYASDSKQLNIKKFFTIPQECKLDNFLWSANSLKEIHLPTYSNDYKPTFINGATLRNDIIIYVPKGDSQNYKTDSVWSTYANQIVEEGAFDKLSTAGGSLTGDVTTTNTTFTNTSLVTKQYVDDTIANLNANATQY